MLEIENGPEIEVTQGQSFDIKISCTNIDGEKSIGEFVIN